METQPMKIEKFKYTAGLDTLKVTGFSDGELYRLKSMPHSDAESSLIRILNERNNGEGTMYSCGYGIYGIWFDNEAAYINIGTSCD